MKSSNGKTMEARGYAPVNGLKMYCEIEGTSDPLVCIPPAFGYAGVNPYPALVQSHRVITADLQGMVARLCALSGQCERKAKDDERRA